MKDLIKANMYQLRKSRLPFVVFFVIFLLGMLSVFLQSMNEDSFSGSYFVAENGMTIPAYVLIFIITFTALVCGGDFMDKTGNYELMSGHLRKDVYFSRALISLIGGVGGSAVLLALPVFVTNIIWGWGTEMDLSGVVIRYMLSLFPIFRMICEVIFLTYIIKNTYIIMASSYFVFIIYMSLPDFFPKAKSAILGLTNYMDLYSFRAWDVYTMAEFRQFSVYHSAVSADTAIMTVVASLGFGILFLILGYLFFKNDDIH